MKDTNKKLTYLGKNTQYSNTYQPSLLEAIQRTREPLESSIYGADIWNAFEVSWLNEKGLPQVNHLQMTISGTSHYIVESKSFKLYLNSLNYTSFSSEEAVLNTIQADLETCLKTQVTCHFLKEAPIKVLDGLCLDHLDIHIQTFENDKHLLNIEKNSIEETVYTHLFRSTCPVTGQPDWATIWINYSGPQINHSSLLKYLVSFRNHQGFHESCIDTIYKDLMTECKCNTLTVYGGFTRRGGIDINPYRSSEKHRTLSYMRTQRQ